MTATAAPSRHAFQTCSSNSAPDRRASLAGRTIGDVRDPHLVRSCRDKPLSQDILGYWQGMLGIGGRREPLNLFAAQSQLLAQALDAPDPSWKPIVPQFCLETLWAVCVSGTHVCRLDRHFQSRILLGACRRTPISPGIVPASGHPKDSAQKS